MMNSCYDSIISQEKLTERHEITAYSDKVFIP